MSQRELAVVLVSGGLDSCVTAAIANTEFELAFLHVNYGQRTEARELKAFEDIATHYNVARRMVIDLESLKKIGGSSLTDDSIEVTKADLDSSEIPTSYVPFRNAHLLATAASWAEVLGAQMIFVGAVEEDSSGYPDCRPKFFGAFKGAIDAGTKPDTQIDIRTPVITMKKSEIVTEGIRLGAPLQLTWSCYKNEDVACGECDSCALRLRGFEQAGVEDPIQYVV